MIIDKTKYNLLNNRYGSIKEDYDDGDGCDNNLNEEIIINLNGIDKRYDKFGLELDEKKKRYYYKFGFEKVSHSLTTPVYDYTFSPYLPNELIGIIEESEYLLIGQYIKMILARDGSPQRDYWYFSLGYLFYFFIPFIIFINQDKDSNIYLYYLIFGCIILLSIYFIYYLPFNKKTKRMYQDIVTLSKRKSVTFENVILGSTKYQLFQFINLLSHLVALVLGVFILLFNQQNHQFIYTLYKIFIIIDIPLICYYLYNYILFTEFRNIIPLSKLLDENDYIKMLNKNIYKAIGHLSFFITYSDINNNNNNNNSDNSLITISASSSNINNSTNSINNSNDISINISN